MSNKRFLAAVLAAIFYLAMLPPVGAINWTFTDNVTVRGHILGTGTGTMYNVMVPTGDNALSYDNAVTAWVDVRAYGAKGDGTTDDTTAISAAIGAATSELPVYFPAGTYIVSPGSTMTWAGSGNIYYVAALKSNLRIFGTGTIKLKDDVSSNSSPKNIIIFGTNQHISDVRIDGITFDLNGANNKINNSSGYLHASIMATGDDAGIDNLVVSGCTFKNGAGGTVIGLGQSNTAGSSLARNIKIVGNNFFNNGLDSPDHSSVYAWADDVIISGNYFYNDTMPTSTRLAVELHGARQEFSNNIVYNFTQGGWLAGNYTSVARDQRVFGNSFSVGAVGMGVYSEAAPDNGVSDINFYGNHVDFDDTEVSGFTHKTGFSLVTTRGVDGIRVSGNTIRGSDSTTLPVYGVRGYCGTAGEKHTNIFISENRFYGITTGVYLQSYNTPGTFGLVSIDRNTFSNFVDFDGYSSSGVFTDFVTALPIDILRIKENIFIDSSSIPDFDYGIFLSGNHSSIDRDGNIYSGLTVSNYSEGTASDASAFAFANYYGMEHRTTNALTFKWSITDNVANGGTIAHGLPTAPSSVIATGSVAGEIVTVTGIDNTNISVGIYKHDGTEGTSQSIRWIALYN